MKKFATLALSIMLTSVVGAQTPCTITHTDIPFVEDFQVHTDSVLFVDGCWQQMAVVQTPVAAPSPHAGIYCDTSGNRSLRLAVAHGRIPLMVTLPPVDSLSDLEISFKFRKEGPEWDGIFNLYNGSIAFGVLEDTNDMNSFVPLFNGSAAADSWFKYTVRLPRYHGSGHILAFRGYKTGNYPNINNPNILADTDTTFVYMYIDSIDIHPIADCGIVEWVEGFNISETQASVRWNDPELAGNFKINLTGGGLDTTVFTTDTRVTFTNLAPNTEYTAWVSVPCASGEEPVSGTQFTTGGCLTPDSITISYITDTSVLITWVPRTEEDLWYNYLYDANGPVGGGGIGVCYTPQFEAWGLTPNTHYTFTVRPYCGLSSQISWSDTIGFTTLPTASDTVWRTVTVTADADGACEPYGSGTYADSSTVEIGYVIHDTAATDGHWQFLGWSDGPTENPREITVTSDTAIVALFHWVEDSLTQTITQSSIQTISVYPNPSHGKITISVDRPSEVSVVDLQGRTVIPATTIISSFTIPHSSLPSGTYLLRITTSSGTTSKKLLIQ